MIKYKLVILVISEYFFNSENFNTERVDLAAQLFISNMWLTVASSCILPEVTEVAWHSYMVRCTFVHVSDATFMWPLC